MNKLLKAMTEGANRTYTENGAEALRSTMNNLLDFFALGGAYRRRSDEDCILLFKKAFEEDRTLAMKCLFYLRDVREGQGERRFFRVVTRWLAKEHPAVMRRNLEYVPLFGRWDDLYTFVGTPLEGDMFALMRHQLAIDVKSKTPSLLGKWMKSINSSSKGTRMLGEATRKAMGMSVAEYRKTLSTLREHIHVTERLMSVGRWSEIAFDKVPSNAGFKYRNAFARHEVERYKTFAESKSTKVNANVLYPYEVVSQALGVIRGSLAATERLMINKYWDNLRDVLNKKPLNGIVVADVSGSMIGTPMEVAISLAMYCAERASGPFENHFISFSESPRLIEIEGVDFCDKVKRIYKSPWGMNTNIEAVFDLLLRNAQVYHLTQEDMSEKVIVVSDMQFDSCVTTFEGLPTDTLFEKMRAKWAACGFVLPKLVFWNVDAKDNGANIPMRDDGNVCYCSGFSPVLFEQLLENKSAMDLMLEKLNSKRYEMIF